MTSNESLYPLCIQCKGYPLIQIQKENTNNITISCKCGFKTSMSIQSYLQSLSPLHSPIQYTCSTHHQSYILYCKKCHIHLCKICKKDPHRKHQLIDLLKDIPSLDKLKQKLTEAHKHLDVYFPSLRDKGKTLSKHASQVDISYEQSYKRNKSILTLVALFINSYTPDNCNYYLFCNIKNVSTIRIYEYTKKPAHDGIIHFFNNYCILYLKYIYIRDFYSIGKDSSNHLMLNNGDFAYTKDEDAVICKIIKNDIEQKSVTLSTQNAYLLSLHQLKNGHFISANSKEIKIWKQNDEIFECLFTIAPLSKNRIKQGERIKGTAIIGDKYIASYSSKHIKLFSLKQPYDGSTIKTFVENTGDIQRVIYNEINDVLIYAMNYKCMIVFISLKSYQCVMRMELGVYKCNSLYCFDSNRLIVGAEETMCVIDVKKGKIERTINFSNESVISFEKISDDYMICVRRGYVSNSNRTLLMFNMNTYENYVVTKFFNIPMRRIIKANDTKLYAFTQEDKMYEIEYYYNLL